MKQPIRGRAAWAMLLLALSACATTSTVQQQHAPSSGQAYAYTFQDSAGGDPAAMAHLAIVIQRRLGDARLLAEEPAADGRLEVELTHFYVRSYAARSLAGILSGRDRIVSQVTILDRSGRTVGRFEVETVNFSAWGSSDGLMEQHADEIVARLRGDHTPS